MQVSSSRPFLRCRSLVLSATAPDLGRGVTPLGHRPSGMGFSLLLPLTSDVGWLLSAVFWRAHSSRLRLSYSINCLPHQWFSGESDGKESSCNPGDWSPTPGSESSSGKENSDLLQCSCLEYFMSREASRDTVHEFTKSCIGLIN